MHATKLLTNMLIIMNRRKKPEVIIMRKDPMSYRAVFNLVSQKPKLNQLLTY